MRQIKFRAWDGTKIVYEFLVARPQFADCLSIMINEDFATKAYNSCLEWKVMQFTGLYDKNGKEIYEGDILKNNRQWSYGLRSGSHFVVEFNVETGRYGLLLRGERLQDSWEDLAALTRKKSNECEVIGNIYENPDLLK